MLNIILKLILFLALEAFSFIEKRYINSFDLSFTQGFNILNGSYYTAQNINFLSGFLYDINEKNLILLNYQFLYAGPSIDLNNRYYGERSINNLLTIQWQSKQNEKIKIIPEFHISKELKKNSIIDDFNNNLYNNNILGGSITANYNLQKENIISFSLIYRRIKFPNYTDLLSEFKTPHSAIEGGLYDNNLYRGSVRYKYSNYFFSIDYTMQNYISQKIILENADYSNTTQKDREIEIKSAMEKKFSIFYFYPSISLIIHRSNQNFLRFKSLTDISPVFIKNAYDYNEYEMEIPASFKIFNLNTAFSLSYRYKKYTERPPRNKDNDYIVYKKQSQKQFIIDFSITKEISDISSIVFYYSFVKSTSNNKFDVYLPLNYTGNYFGFGYKIRY